MGGLGSLTALQRFASFGTGSSILPLARIIGRGGWEPAKAKVAAVRESSKFAMGATETQKRYDYVVDISPSGGAEPFSTTMVTPMMTRRWRPLQVGNVVKVLFQPQTRNVKWDKNEQSTSRQAVWDAAEKARKRTADKAYDKALHERERHSAD